MIRRLLPVLLCSLGATAQQTAPLYFTVESDSPVVFSGTVRAAETPEERLRYSYEVASVAVATAVLTVYQPYEPQVRSYCGRPLRMQVHVSNPRFKLDLTAFMQTGAVLVRRAGE